MISTGRPTTSTRSFDFRAPPQSSNREQPTVPCGDDVVCPRVANAVLGDEPAALRDLARVREVTASYPTADNGTALRIAARALEGEIALRCGEPEEAILHFREAARLEDELTCNEPPTWYYPMRHSLGVALPAANRPVEAERISREDLKRFPGDGGSLFGLLQSLERQGRTTEARKVRTEFTRAWAGTDIVLPASRL